jgi:hypothetical protein
VNLTDPNGGSYGLWQINGVHDPLATGTYPNMVPTSEWKIRMQDPLENAKAAFKVYTSAGKSFAPWGAFTRTMHRPYMDTAKVALDARQRIAQQVAINESQGRRIEGLLADMETLEATIEAQALRITDLSLGLQSVAAELEVVKDRNQAQYAVIQDYKLRVASLMGQIERAIVELRTT